MRGATALTALALAAALTACSGGGESDGPGRADGTKEHPAASGTPQARACADGTFAWTGVRQTDKLTGVSDAATATGRDGGRRTKALRRVYTPRPDVTGEGPDVPAAEVLFSLGKKIGVIETDARTLARADGETWSFTDVHQKPPALDSNITEAGGAARDVLYAGVREVTGTFRHTCADGRSTTGRARGWTVDLGGILACDEPLDRSADSALARQAARLSCDEDDAAAQKI
ncbi:hypothetical protein GTY65_33715 [Streptomyces sp. SID8379]|uniref:hypothetical protein n=1 Tax=unclassified Streptomyces TaxID=2593676 RepID=UPI00036F7096|nr:MULTISPECIES: hypothetical protein [unclassified Streptomyces]MYW68997.1 hypothetical protein [Streptomyces sp. SID8379]